MEGGVVITIPNTLTKTSGSLFSRSYTVKPTQLYEIHVRISKNCEIIASKRYSELLSLSEIVIPIQLKPIIMQERISLPKFPEKRFKKLNESLVTQRRLEIENWLRCAIRHQFLANKIYDFLDFVQETSNTDTKAKVNPDEIQILDFVDKVKTTSNNRMKLIENFSWQFFSKKRIVQQEIIGKLVECLIPLCGDDFLGSKALDILSKLTTGDYFRDFTMVSKELSKFPPEILKTMNLHEYLTKKRFSDSQLQAYTLCKILEESLGKANLYEIVIVT